MRGGGWGGGGGDAAGLGPGWGPPSTFHCCLPLLSSAGDRVSRVVEQAEGAARTRAHPALRLAATRVTTPGLPATGTTAHTSAAGRAEDAPALTPTAEEEHDPGRARAMDPTQRAVRPGAT